MVSENCEYVIFPSHSTYVTLGRQYAMHSKYAVKKTECSFVKASGLNHALKMDSQKAKDYQSDGGTALDDREADQ
jgi:hypothetical protein